MTKGQISGAVFFSFYLILNSYVPLDLIVTIEIAKFVCTPLMQADVEMKHIDVVPIGDNKYQYLLKGFEANTLNLHEDMVEIEYIFSDKTGTLTKNELVFKRMSIVSGNNVERI